MPMTSFILFALVAIVFGLIYFCNRFYEEKSIEKVVNLASLDGNIKGTHEIVFDSLDSNTIYTAVLDEFSFASSTAISLSE